MLQPDRVSRGWSILSSRSLVHFVTYLKDSSLTAYPWLLTSLKAQTVLVP